MAAVKLEIRRTRSWRSTTMVELRTAPSSEEDVQKNARPEDFEEGAQRAVQKTGNFF